MNGRNVVSLKIVRYSLLSSLSLLLHGWEGGLVQAQEVATTSQELVPTVTPTMASHLVVEAEPSTTAPASTAPTLAKGVQPLMSQSQLLTESCQPLFTKNNISQTCPSQTTTLLAQAGSLPSEPLEAPSTTTPDPTTSPDSEAASPLDLPPDVIESSPVLQEWLQRTPDIADEIANEPSFRPRLRLGYSQFPSNGNIGGVNAGVEDVFVWPGTGLTLSGDYARSWNGDREMYGAQARFYLFPLGGYVNFAPVLGYRQLSTRSYTTSGVDVGMRLMIIPSRGGGADVALSQSWVAPGTQDEIGMTGATIGYAVTSQLRLSTDLQFQNSRFGQDSRLGLNLEWLL
ncbi:MAG TPA: hypothetical protein V6D07_17855 [Trichocoleus sp.]